MKAIFDIIKILIVLGIALFMNVASNIWLSQFSNHVTTLISEDQYFNSINLTHILSTAVQRWHFLFLSCGVIFLN